MTIVYFDASRLFLRGGQIDADGIDRVVFAYARWLGARSKITLVPVWSRMGYLSKLSSRRFHEVVELTNSRSRAGVETASGATSWDTLVAALKRPDENALAIRPRRDSKKAAAEIKGYAGAILSALASPREIELRRDALFFNVNHYGLEHPLLLNRLAKAGVRPVVLIHDLIPVNFPEFCSPGGAQRHRRRIEDALRYAHRIIANSQSTSDELARFAQEHDLPAPNCTVAPLGLETAFLQAEAAPLATAPYFVCVGTIEPRKNYSFLLSVWRRLSERLGEQTPRLVLVGRRGWENESIVDQLERSPAVLRNVHEVNDLGDHEVARLIGGAVALLSPSFAEGFNLPVIEALSLSTPVIASDIAVHRELATGATLLDPLDGPGWLDAITRALAGGPAPAPFEAPSWKAHFQLVAAALALE